MTQNAARALGSNQVIALGLMRSLIRKMSLENLENVGEKTTYLLHIFHTAYKLIDAVRE